MNHLFLSAEILAGQVVGEWTYQNIKRFGIFLQIYKKVEVFIPIVRYFFQGITHNHLIIKTEHSFQNKRLNHQRINRL